VGGGRARYLIEMRRPLASLLLLWVLLGLCALANAEPLANWTANYPTCRRHTELLKHGPMSLGVRLSTSNPLLAREFKSALDFWATVLDLDWHEDNSENCSIEVVDGQRDLFEPEPENMAARSQFPDRRGFQGWIVFNPAVALNRTELYRISVHEIGHMLGLRHSSNTLSLMYGLDLDCSESLDEMDLAALAARHKLRVASLTQPVKLTKLP
jgi:Matrixin